MNVAAWGVGKEIHYLSCHTCGKVVSTGYVPVPTDTPDKGLIVRAWIECPECLEKKQKALDALDEWRLALDELHVVNWIGVIDGMPPREAVSKLLEMALDVERYDLRIERDELVQRCERQAVTIEERQRSWQEIRAERDEAHALIVSLRAKLTQAETERDLKVSHEP